MANTKKIIRYFVVVLSTFFFFIGSQQAFANEGLQFQNACTENQGLITRRNYILALLQIERCGQQFLTQYSEASSEGEANQGASGATSALGQGLCSAALSLALSVAAAPAVALSRSRITRLRTIGTNATAALARTRTRINGDVDPDPAIDPDRTRTGDVDTEGRIRGRIAGQTAYGAVLLTAAPAAVNAVQNYREHLVGSTFLGQEDLCEYAGAPVIEDPSSPSRCRIDPTNSDALLQFLMNDSALQRVATNQSDFCDQFEELILDIYERVTGTNGLLAGGLQIIDSPQCHAEGHYTYFLRVDNEAAGGPQVFEIDVDERTPPPAYSIRNANSTGVPFNSLNFRISDEGRMDFTDFRARYQNGTEQTIGSSEATTGNRDFLNMRKYSESLGHLNAAFYGDAVEACCDNRSRCADVGVDSSIQAPAVPDSTEM